MARKRRRRKSTHAHTGLPGMGAPVKSMKHEMQKIAAIPTKKEVIIFNAAHHTESLSPRKSIEVFRSSSVTVRQEVKNSHRKRRKRQNRQEVKRFPSQREQVTL